MFLADLTRTQVTEIACIPTADRPHGPKADESENQEESHIAAVVGCDNKRDEQRTDRTAEISANLKDRLGESSSLTACKRSDARCLRMECGRTDSDHENSDKNTGKGGAESKKHNADGCGTHAHRQTPHKGTAVKGIAHNRLKNRSRKLIDKRDETDFGKIDSQIGLEHRIDRSDHRLEQIIKTMGSTESKKDVERRHLSQPAQFLKESGHDD